MPVAIKPAPTIPTLIGVLARSSRSSSRSTMNMKRSLLIGGRNEAYALAHKIGPVAVLIGDDGGLGGPVDTECRIIPAHAALGFGRVELGHQIRQLRVVHESQEGVGAAFRDEQHAVTRGTEFGRNVSHEGWRVRRQIEHHVVHGAANATQELVLLVRGGLLMEATQRVLVTVEG